MSIKFKTVLLTIVIALVGTMFAGCDTWSWDYGQAHQPPFTSGTTVTDKTQDPNFDASDEDLVDEDQLVDASTYYDFLDGVKFAYDGKAHKIEVLNDARFDAVYSRVSQYLESNSTIDCQAFADTNSELGVDATFISRTVWLYNFVNQYQTLARTILTKIAQNYGYGIEAGYQQHNNLYGSLAYDAFEIEDLGDFMTNKNAINAGVFEVSDTLTASNPYYGLGIEAIYDDGGLYVDFSNDLYVDFPLSFDVPSRAYYFAMNLNSADPSQTTAFFVITDANPYYDPDNLVNQPTIPNPDYDPDNPDSGEEYIDNTSYYPGHILGQEEVSFVGTVDSDGNISYELGTAETVLVEPNAFIDQYVEAYTNYLALKLLETHLKVNSAYAGEYADVTYLDLLSLYEQWSAQIGSLGFAETYADEFGQKFDTLEQFTQCVLDNVVGQDTIDADYSAGEYSRDLENGVAQIVADAMGAQVSAVGEGEDAHFVFVDENGQPLFASVNNVEWKDYSLQELFVLSTDSEEGGEQGAQNLQASNVDDPLTYPEGPDLTPDEPYEDTFIYLPDEHIYSIVFMLKPDYEPMVMQLLMLIVLSPYSDLDVDLLFRYVKGGEEQIFEKIDYTIQNTSSEDGGYDLNNTFTGHLPKFEDEELTLDNSDDYIFALDEYNTPSINTIRNQEILLERFTNNLASAYSQALNVSFGADRYAYSEELDTYYYNEADENCDFVEINFCTHAPETMQGQDVDLRLRLAIFEMFFETLSSLQGADE